MMLVLSGEGPTDLGRCRTSTGICSDADFARGPFTVLLDHLLEARLHYRPSDYEQCVFVSKQELLHRDEARKRERRRSVSLVGKKKDQETGYYFTNAWMLGEIAVELEHERGDRGIAVLHRDSDDRNAPSRAEWESKLKSMLDGFQRGGYDRGVAMLPRPISEAWLLCAARPAMPSCEALEAERGNDKALNPLKEQLAAALDGEKDAEALCDWVQALAFDTAKARSMPSFARFHDRLLEALELAMEPAAPSAGGSESATAAGA